MTREAHARADVVIWLRLWRVTVRSVRYLGQNRFDLPDGCREQIGMQTLEFYRFILRTRQSARMRVTTLIASAGPQVQVVIRRSRGEVARWLESS